VKSGEPGVGSASFAVVRGDGSILPARLYVDPTRAPLVTLVLAHGAGAGQAHPFMVCAAEALAMRGVAVVTFDFPYTAAGRRLPDKAPVLERAFLDAIAWVRTRDDLPRPLAIGGKSMGGRMASHVAAYHADEAGALEGLVFLGYPLHPPAKPLQRRDAHLPLLRSPMLFVQGGRDAFGTPDELQQVMVALSAPASLHVVEAADHGFGLPRRADPAAALAEVWDVVAAWVRDRVQTSRMPV
jgi:predicted alpha/beta-hydrolase family hydrolase